LDVLQRTGARQQVEALEDEAELPVADVGELVLAQSVDPLAVQDVRPRGRPVQAADDVHHRGLAGAGRAHDRDHLARLDEQVHTAQRVHLVLPHAVDPGQVPRLDHVAHRGALPGAQNSPGGRRGPERCCAWNGLAAAAGAAPVVTAAITCMPSRTMSGPVMAVGWPSVMPVRPGTAFTLPSASRYQSRVGGAPRVPLPRAAASAPPGRLASGPPAGRAATAAP